MECPTIAIAGAGDMAKYLVEELLKEQYIIAIITRGDRPWFQNRAGVTVHITAYDRQSILGILNSTRSAVLFSFLHSNDPKEFVSAQTAMLEACRESNHCKRFVPSEYGGDIDRFPLLPRFYEPTHVAFRHILQAQNEVEWTLVNHGWFADYFVDSKKTYMKPLPTIWPIDMEAFEYFLIGSGEERIGWTAARDVAKALVKLVGYTKRWPQHVYVSGEIGTWNHAVKQLEEFHGKLLKRLDNDRASRSRSTESINQAMVKHLHDEDPTILWQAYMDEWNITGASATPWDIVLSQRQELFSDIKFRTIGEVLRDGQTMEKI